MSEQPAAKRQKVAKADAKKAAPQKVFLTIYEVLPIEQGKYERQDTDILGVYTTKAAAVDHAKLFSQGLIHDGDSHAKIELIDALTAWGPKNGFSPQAIGDEPTGDWNPHVYVKGMTVKTF